MSHEAIDPAVNDRILRNWENRGGTVAAGKPGGVKDFAVVPGHAGVLSDELFVGLDFVAVAFGQDHRFQFFGWVLVGDGDLRLLTLMVGHGRQVVAALLGLFGGNSAALRVVLLDV